MGKEICLVTGGAGFIGSNLVDHLIKRMSVVIIDNFDPFLVGKSRVGDRLTNDAWAFYFLVWLLGCCGSSHYIL